jgi:hypothetical protein
MTIGRLLVFFLFLGAGYGVYQAFLEFKARQKEERNQWPSRVASVMTLHSSKKLLAGELKGNQSSFLQLLYFCHQIDQDGYPLLETLKKGASIGGLDTIEAPLLAAAVLDNYNLARNTFGVFQDPANLLKLERGEPPIAISPGWEDELLVVGYKLSPLLGAELSATLPNMVIMPESVRNMQTDLTPPEAQTLNTQWLGARLISPECSNAISEKIKLDSDLR